MCTFSANLALDTATYERTNIYKTTQYNMSRTYLDITCAESGLESPPFSQNVEYGVKNKCLRIDLIRLD